MRNSIRRGHYAAITGRAKEGYGNAMLMRNRDHILAADLLTSEMLSFFFGIIRETVLFFVIFAVFILNSVQKNTKDSAYSHKHSTGRVHVIRSCTCTTISLDMYVCACTEFIFSIVKVTPHVQSHTPLGNNTHNRVIILIHSVL